MRQVIVLAVMIASLSCAKSEDRGGPPTENVNSFGSAGQGCYPNGTCNEGLACVDGSCAQPVAGTEGKPCREDGSCDEGLRCHDGGCLTAEAARAAQHEQVLGQLAAIVDDACACKDMPCARKEMERLQELEEPEDSDNLPEEVQKRAVAEAQRLEKCMKKLSDRERLNKEPNSGLAKALEDSEKHPCKVYEASIVRFSKCDKLPDQAREAMLKSLEQLRKAWAERGMEKFSSACVQGQDALRKSAESVGCKI